jgi:hypothetical protein
MVALADLALGHSLPAQVGLVHLDDAAQQATFVFHHSANALAEKPCGLLADAKMLGQLDRRDAFAAGGYQIKRREPRPHRQVRAFVQAHYRHCIRKSIGPNLLMGKWD